MKLSSLFLVGMLVAALVVMAAPVAKADGVTDPHIIINSCACDATTFDATNSATNPLVLDFFDATQNFQYIGSTPLTTLFIELSPIIVPGVYDCTSDIFTTCSVYAPPANAFGLEFVLTGGSISQDQTISATVTPEPSALLLLAVGIVALLGFHKKLGLSASQAAQ